MTPAGEHIYYSYLAENGDNVDLSGNEAGRDRSAMRYLSKVQYGNATPAADLYSGLAPHPQHSGCSPWCLTTANVA
ncbi:65 kDa virulence protein [Salmonella enterica subsp. arizonae]|uniref:65 kDa virulence protein n=1 Tax=Salmonella enterica subsp. arizonae TaxID=59203 RepID=A0A379S4M5_SALER|nr:65 kDa virulence protein [Salmonella enterica subsp. arizonae]